MSRPAATVVMYHYVRPLAATRFPAIKGLDLALFREQLEFIRRHYTVIRMEELIAAVRSHRADGSWELPDNALLLTFDDGYADHYQYVFPLLDDYGWQGTFFPPACGILDGRVLDVNKIHFTLASVKDPDTLVADLFRELAPFRAEHGSCPIPSTGRPSPSPPGSIPRRLSS